MMTAGTRVIKDQAALDALLAEYFGEAKSSWPKGSVDFARETVLAVSAGRLPCGNHVQIEDIQQAEAGKLKVRYRAVPRPMICVTGEVVSPVQIVVAGLAANQHAVRGRCLPRQHAGNAVSRSQHRVPEPEQ
ncbi:MAG: hypothetical protein IPL70_16320 [Uliginosibacterium sp.]|nr:hypothetical protein [Uliginosibacterium sp.]